MQKWVNQLGINQLIVPTSNQPLPPYVIACSIFVSYRKKNQNAKEYTNLSLFKYKLGFLHIIVGSIPNICIKKL